MALKKQAPVQDSQEQGTGVFKATIKRVGFTVNSTKSKSLTVTANLGGEYDTTFYEGVVETADGKPGFAFDSLLNPLANICDVEDFIEGKAEIETKDGTKTVDVYEGFEDMEVLIAVQKVWDDYSGKWKRVIKKFFNTDGFTAAEIADGAEEPKQIKWFQDPEKFKDFAGKGGAKADAKEAPKDEKEEDLTQKGEDVF